MRVTSMAAGLAIVLAACGGGEKKAAMTADDGDSARQTARSGCRRPRLPPAARRTMSNMVLEGSSYKYVPDSSPSRPATGPVPQQERRPAQRVVLARQHSGRRAPTALKAGMPDQMAPLEGQLHHRAERRSYDGHLRRRAGRRVQDLLPAAPRAGHEGQDHGPVVRPRRPGDPPALPEGRLRCGPRSCARAAGRAGSASGDGSVDVALPAPHRRSAQATRAHDQPGQRVHRRSASGSTPPPMVSSAVGTASARPRRRDPPARRRGGDARRDVRVGNAAPYELPAASVRVDQPRRQVVDEPCRRARET